MIQKRKIYYALFGIILFGFLIVMIFISDNWDRNKLITNINIEKLEIADSNKIFEIAKKYSLNRKKDSVLLKAIERAVEKDIYVSKCNASFDGNEGISLKIYERTAIAYFYSNNKIFLIDEGGVIMPYKVLKSLNNLYLISGFDIKDSLLTTNAIDILKSLNNATNTIIKNSVSDIEYSFKHNSFVLGLDLADIKILFGRNRDDRKVRILENYLISNFKELVSINNAYIDIRWKNRIIKKIKS